MRLLAVDFDRSRSARNRGPHQRRQHTCRAEPPDDDTRSRRTGERP